MYRAIHLYLYVIEVKDYDYDTYKPKELMCDRIRFKIRKISDKNCIFFMFTSIYWTNLPLLPR